MPKLRKTNQNPPQKPEETNQTSKITFGKKWYVKNQLATASPTILIGKAGVTQQCLNEIKKQLDKNKMVKAKLLKTALAGKETKALVMDIAQKTESTLVEIRGHTFMLYKPHKK